MTELVKKTFLDFTIKAIDEDERLIEGYATTKSVDAVGDVINPKGAEFKLPIPLLHQHDSKSPIGEVYEAKVSNESIKIKAKIAKTSTPGKLKDRLDEVWESVKLGLLKGLSVGVLVREASPNANGGVDINKWLWTELSVVVAPANNSAIIERFKSLDSTNNKNDKGLTQMNISNHIVSLKEALVQKKDQLEAIKTKAVTEARTFEQAELSDIETLEAEIVSLEKNVSVFEKQEQVNAVKATTVLKSTTALTRPSYFNSSVAGPDRDPGIGFARLAKVKAISGRDHVNMGYVAEKLYGKKDPELVNLVKAVVEGGTTADADWAGPLVANSSIVGDFLAFLRPQTIIGKFGTGNVPALTRVPFRTRLVTETSGAASQWVGEGKAKPLTKVTYSSTSLLPLKAATLVVVTEELLRDSDPSAETLIRNQIADAIVARMDTDFANVAYAGSAGVAPASIFYGSANSASSGNTAAAIRLDVRTAMAAFLAGDNPPESGVWIMKPSTALALSLMMNELGQPEFPAVTMAGGTFVGLPVITSRYMPATASPAGDVVGLVNARDIQVAEGQGLTIDFSREATIEMSDAPTGASGNSVVAANTDHYVSMFQTNSVVFRSEESKNWRRGRDSGVYHLTSVNWGE